MALAEALGAIVDPGGGGGAGLAFQAIGSSTATFGEIRDRAGLVVVWRADPAVTNPRLLGRLRLDRAARGRGRSSSSTRSARRPRRRPTRSSSSTRRSDFEALWALRALVAGAPLDRDRAGDLPLDALGELAQRLAGADHVAFLHGALDELGALALFSLVRDLSRDRHAVTLALRGEGNARGAEDVLAWQTGFPAAVSFARGHPRANPGELSAAALLERGEVDAALVIALRRARRGCRACASCRPWSSTRATPRRRRRRAWPSPPRSRASRSRAPRTAWTACPSRCARCWTATARAVEDVLAAIAGRL